MKTFKNFVENEKKSIVAHAWHGENRKLETIYAWHGDDRSLSELNEGYMQDWSSETEPSGKHEFDPKYFYKQNGYKQTKKYVSSEINPELVDEHMKNINQQDHNVIGNYISRGKNFGHESGSKELNKNLIELNKQGKRQPSSFTYKPHTDDSYEQDPHIINLDHLDSALDKNKLTKKLTTYTGVGFDPVDLRNEHMIHLPSYTSGSLNRAVATKYTNPEDRHILQIEHDVGHTGMYVGNNKKITPFKDNEFIMPRGINIELHHTPEEHEDTDGTKFKIWKATRI